MSSTSVQAVAAAPALAPCVSPNPAHGLSGTPTALADAAGERGNTPARFDGLLVPGFAPCNGWSLMWTEEEDGDWFLTDLYFARSDTEDRLIDHCRFNFMPTQERFNWLVRNGFPSAGPGPWTDAKIDAAMARDRAKVTAHIWEDFGGSDDPRAIQGGGGAGRRLVKTCTNSLWLIKAYVALLKERFGEEFSYSLVGRAAA